MPSDVTCHTPTPVDTYKIRRTTFFHMYDLVDFMNGICTTRHHRFQLVFSQNDWSVSDREVHKFLRS